MLCFAHCKNDDNGGGGGDNTSPDPAPELTCTPDDTAILNATLTVENCTLSSNVEIYGLATTGVSTCGGSVGSITEADFSTLDGNSYTISALGILTYLGGSEASIGVGGQISSANKLTLDLLKSGDTTSATFSLGGVGVWGGTNYTWDSPGITWADGDIVCVKIYESP